MADQTKKLAQAPEYFAFHKKNNTFYSPVMGRGWTASRVEGWSDEVTCVLRRPVVESISVMVLLFGFTVVVVE